MPRLVHNRATFTPKQEPNTTTEPNTTHRLLFLHPKLSSPPGLLQL